MKQPDPMQQKTFILSHYSQTNSNQDQLNAILAEGWIVADVRPLCEIKYSESCAEVRVLVLLVRVIDVAEPLLKTPQKPADPKVN